MLILHINTSFERDTPTNEPSCIQGMSGSCVRFADGTKRSNWRCRTRRLATVILGSYPGRLVSLKQRTLGYERHRVVVAAELLPSRSLDGPKKEWL